ncbi:hypothetical protein NNC19_07150 [Clostridium sp. SHJSY1]|uniref:hypothetical protein n=1 Tax=Clostridium sp. SHJSY1 TaxID=2942483 RepID=UPI00287487B5|nr:hypothetical protein [Clostridium sp. SHJSY1]MDS0525450.1 hypothetical protein [Clostridium sp. SHJSY1]
MTTETTNTTTTTTGEEVLKSDLSQMLRDLIVAKYFPKDEFITKINVFYTFAQISEAEYNYLMLLVTKTFGATSTTKDSTDTKTTN